MARMIEASQATLEMLAASAVAGTDARLLAPRIALAKVDATRCFEYCAREASQILGGASYLRQGVGERVERLYREVRVLAIGGGSEEIMLDFAVRGAKL